MTPRRMVEAFATGLWLGLLQLTLGFALMAGVGAAALLFLALTASWIGGGALGVLWGRGRGPLLLPLALGLATAAHLTLARATFSATAVAVTLAAGLAAGAYAGCFLRDRAAAWSEVRRLLLHENNGFVCGYAAGGTLLLLSASALELTVALLGLALCANELLARRRAGSVY